MKFSKIRMLITPIFFFALLITGMVHYVFSIITAQESISLASRLAITNFFDSNIFAHDFWIDVYGIEQKYMGKRQIEKFEIYKTDYEKLVAVQKEQTVEEVEEKVDEVYSIMSYLDNENIPYYYLTSILSVQDVSDLPYGVTDGRRVNQQRTRDVLTEKNVHIIDLGAAESVKAIPKEKLFYRTDHHWSLETCFAAYQEVVNTMESDFEWDLNAGETTDRKNYSEYRNQDSFLGSYGVKVGDYYTGKEDFVVFIPVFDTDMLFQRYDADGELQLEKSGDFYQTLLDTKILEDSDYKNKYNAFCNRGSIENHVVNYSAPNSLKCLLISHSFGRPLTMYLALNFYEVVNLDPQSGRFKKSYIDYIDIYEPDVVLFQVEIEGEIIGEYREGK